MMTGCSVKHFDYSPFPEKGEYKKIIVADCHKISPKYADDFHRFGLDSCSIYEAYGVRFPLKGSDKALILYSFIKQEFDVQLVDLDEETKLLIDEDDYLWLIFKGNRFSRTELRKIQKIDMLVVYILG